MARDRVNTAASPDDALLGEAADWLIQFHSRSPTAAERGHFERWRSQSPAHAAAWQRAECVLSTFEQLPARTTRATLERLQKPGRRQWLRALGVTGVAGWIAWREIPWADWQAEIRTATGEQRRIQLSDGTQLVLNTASAVDVRFTESERRLILHTGEVLITTGQESARQYRPFLVQTSDGTARAIGTRYSVRRLHDSTRVGVFEGTVEVRPVDSPFPVIVHAGEQTVFERRVADPPQWLDPTAASWENGMFVARDIPLAALIAELSRYRRGMLRCSPDCANMRVSGAFPIANTDACLVLLQKTLPLRINSLSRYWVTVEPRS